MRNIKVVFFAKIPDLRDMNKAVLYVRENEITSSLQVSGWENGDSPARKLLKTKYLHLFCPDRSLFA